jgi:hypothetical protein
MRISSLTLPLLRFAFVMGLALAWAGAAVVKVDVSETSAAPYGYERLKGTVSFAIDPRHPGNRGITDVQLAPRNLEGLVEFSADVCILRPRDPAKSNGILLFEVVNRGKKGLLPMFNRGSGSVDPITPDHFGDGLLMEEGYTLVWLGWQHDVPSSPELMRLHAPVAKGVTGWVRSEYTPNTVVSTIPLGDANHIPYKPVDPRQAKVSVRDRIDGPRTLLSRDAWRIENGHVVRLAVPATPGKLYEVIYESKDPIIAGLALAGIRDWISHLKRKEGFEHAIGFGVSQSAMVLRAFLYEGFNQDEHGARVFDGVFAHVAGARRSTFQRFVQPSRTAGPLRNASFSTTEQAPFHDEELLARARAAKVVPKIFYTNSTYEYWGSGASLLHTSTDGSQDRDLPESTRLYVFAGGQHGPASFPPKPSGGYNLPNFNDYRWSVRALLRSMRNWVVSGAEPPASVYPALRAGTLTPLDGYKLRSVKLPAEIHTPRLLDFGRDYERKGVITKEPPTVVRAYTTLVPQADNQGNDLGAVRMPEVDCPIAAYTGWNLRHESLGAAGYLLGNVGSYLPFSRKEIHNKFLSQGRYLSCVEGAALSLAGRGFLLQRDIPSLTDAASRHWLWRMEEPGGILLQTVR